MTALPHATDEDIRSIADLICQFSFRARLDTAVARVQRAQRIENDHERERRVIAASADVEAIESLIAAKRTLLVAREKASSLARRPDSPNRPVTRPRDRVRTSDGARP